MTTGKADTRKLISPEQMAALSARMWDTLQLMTQINNTFLERMQKSTTLGPEDERELEQWSKAIARASRGVHETLELMNGPPEGKALN